MAATKQQISVRVYYEDTDFSGRVYHASYLRFFERGRTEWLRALGLQHSELAKLSELSFAIVEMQVKFLAHAEIDDDLTIVTNVEAIEGSLLVFQQAALRGERPLVTGRISVVTLRRNRPVKPPAEIIAALPAVTRRSRDRSVR